ncbi:YegS/Rv2252/BmrU family lipid kinase [Olivibacter ginsenosidimutans]|uniref:YegS/Rv2252/BmrU family lipid kinase n=2 Tax=Olivibacter ginsenosidimutans TaxID=1176537 RepID=A0ABP9BS76_9SPHI
MHHDSPLVLYFIVNPRAGQQQIDYALAITNFFEQTPHRIHIHILTSHCSIDTIKADIAKHRPNRVIAVGGDGTVKLAAECIIGSDIALAIIPAGSANGMAREINLKNNVKSALSLVINGKPKAIHALRINHEISLHLADIGMNAKIVKKFQSLQERGMIGYAKATWRALKRHKKMHVALHINGKTILKKAEMVILANGTTYGTGVKINNIGSLFDNQFEVIIVKWFSFIELIKMCFNFHIRFNPFKTEIIQTNQVTIDTKENTFFQIDGEYLGKVRHIEAKLIPHALYLIT